MANMTVNQRSQFERVELSVPSTGVRVRNRGAVIAYTLLAQRDPGRARLRDRGRDRRLGPGRRPRGHRADRGRRDDRGQPAAARLASSYRPNGRRGAPRRRGPRDVLGCSTLARGGARRLGSAHGSVRIAIAGSAWSSPRSGSVDRDVQRQERADLLQPRGRQPRRDLHRQPQRQPQDAIDREQAAADLLVRIRLVAGRATDRLRQQPEGHRRPHEGPGLCDDRGWRRRHAAHPRRQDFTVRRAGRPAVRASRSSPTGASAR